MPSESKPQPFNEDMVVRNDLPRDAFELIHDLAYDHEGRERFQYRSRAQKILMQPDAKAHPPAAPDEDHLRRLSHQIWKRIMVDAENGREIIYQELLVYLAHKQPVAEAPVISGDGLEVHAQATKLAMRNGQVVGEKSDYFVTLEQLESLLKERR